MTQLDTRYIGSISEATMRTQDLLPRFLEVLKQAEPEHEAVTRFQSIWDAAQLLADEIGYVSGADGVLDSLGYWESDSASYLLNEDVFEALNQVAPEGTYFGSSEGDGASYGFWYSYDECDRCHERHDPIEDCADDEEVQP